MNFFRKLFGRQNDPAREEAEKQFDRGFFYQLIGNPEQAIAHYSQAIELNPRLAAAWFARGAILGDNGHQDRAIADYDAALRLEPNNAEIYNSRGIARIVKGYYHSAISDFSKAIEIDQDDASAWCHRANAYANLGEARWAKSDYYVAINLRPDYALAYHNLGAVYATEGDYEQAIVNFTRAVEINPDFTEALANLEHAIKSSERTMGKDTDPTGISSNVSSDSTLYSGPAADLLKHGLEYIETGDFDNAIATFSEAIRVDPNNAGLYYLRGTAIRNLNQWTDVHASANFLNFPELSYTSDVSEAFTSMTKRNSAKWNLIISDYDSAILLDPSYAFAYHNRAIAHAEAGDYDKSASDFLKSMNLDPYYHAAYEETFNKLSPVSSSQSISEAFLARAKEIGLMIHIDDEGWLVKFGY